MKVRLLLALIIGLATTTAALAMPVSARAQGSAQHQGGAAVHRHPDPGLFISRVGYLGEQKYPSVYAGVQLAAGMADIYVVPGHNSAFLNAVAAVDTAGVPYSIKYAARSYAMQAAASQWISAHHAALRKEGITPQWWGPHQPEDAVQVALQTPTTSQLADLQAATSRVRDGYMAKRPLELPQGTAVTRSNYLRVASAVLNAQAPSAGDIVVLPALLKPGEESNWNNDNKPFYGADKIWYTLNNSTYCTSNFSFNGANNPSNHWMVTAAHCSNQNTGHDWYTCYTKDNSGNCNYNVGTVNTVYYNKDDYETTLTSNAGYLWQHNSAGNYWSINGWIEAVQNTYVSTDGATDGVVFHIYVVQGGSATCFYIGSHQVCHGIVLSSANPLCPGGDSGGAMFSRESNDSYHVYAAGIIQARSSDNVGDYYCYGQEIFWIRDEANLLLIWGN